MPPPKPQEMVAGQAAWQLRAVVPARRREAPWGLPRPMASAPTLDVAESPGVNLILSRAWPGFSGRVRVGAGIPIRRLPRRLAAIQGLAVAARSSVHPISLIVCGRFSGRSHCPRTPWRAFGGLPGSHVSKGRRGRVAPSARRQFLERRLSKPGEAVRGARSSGRGWAGARTAAREGAAGGAVS